MFASRFQVMGFNKKPGCAWHSSKSAMKFLQLLMYLMAADPVLLYLYTCILFCALSTLHPFLVDENCIHKRYTSTQLNGQNEDGQGAIIGCRATVGILGCFNVGMKSIETVIKLPTLHQTLNHLVQLIPPPQGPNLRVSQ